MSLHDRDPVIGRIDAVLAEHQQLDERQQGYATDPDGRPVADEPQPLVADHPQPTLTNPSAIPPCAHHPHFVLTPLPELTPAQVAELKRQLERKFAKQSRKPYRMAYLDEDKGKWVPLRRPWWRRVLRLAAAGWRRRLR